MGTQAILGPGRKHVKVTMEGESVRVSTRGDGGSFAQVEWSRQFLSKGPVVLSKCWSHLKTVSNSRFVDPAVLTTVCLWLPTSAKFPQDSGLHYFGFFHISQASPICITIIHLPT